MLDCPPQIHTSPTITLRNRTVRRPSVTFMVYGPPVAGGVNVICQWPSGPATQLTPLSAICTRIGSPGLDHPQIVSGFPLCNTMLSANIVLTSGSDAAVASSRLPRKPSCGAGLDTQPAPARRPTRAARSKVSLQCFTLVALSSRLSPDTPQAPHWITAYDRGGSSRRVLAPRVTGRGSCVGCTR